MGTVLLAQMGTVLGSGADGDRVLSNGDSVHCEAIVVARREGAHVLGLVLDIK